MSKRSTRILSVACAAIVAVLGQACDSSTSPDGGTDPEPRIEFGQAELDLGENLSGTIEISNTGETTAGPIALSAGTVRDDAGGTIAGASVEFSPAEVPTLAPGEQVAIAIAITLPSEGAPPGDYSVAVEALLDGESVGLLAVAFSVAPPPNGPTSIAITAGPATPRQGDVVTYAAEVRDTAGDLLPDASPDWSVLPTSAGLFAADGRFVGYAPGEARVVASIAGVDSTLADTLTITIGERGLSGSFQVVGEGPVADRFTSDLWVHGNFAYTGTWGCRAVCGDKLQVWDVTDPAAPAPAGSLLVDARTVNDVKVRADGQLAVITHEGSDDGLNGITLVDLTDPAQPDSISRFTTGLTSGVHNVWVEGDFVYAAVDGGIGMRVVDISNPAEPQPAGSFFAGESFVHDVYVRDGLAFLSHWNVGLAILDVGSGIAGGTPTNPMPVSKIELDGQTHNAWYWPEGDYVFVGEEDFGAPGVMHVVDVQDLSAPVEVATFRVIDSPPHNFWLDEDRSILYMAWYGKGLHALDVSGTLMGELDRQGREIASIEYGTVGVCPGGGTGTCSWAPQLHDGLIYVSDNNRGLVILEPLF